MKRLFISSLVLMTGCATVPQGPTYMQYAPGTKERYCAEIAYKESPTGHGGQEAATAASIGAVAGAALGAIAGALLGDPGIGAAAGAGMGLMGGGTGMQRADNANRQRQAIFMECMTQKWNR